MTYKLNPIVGKLISPIILRFRDSDTPDRYFNTGLELADEIFDRCYLIDSICAQGDQIVLTVIENNMINSTDRIKKCNTPYIGFF